MPDYLRLVCRPTGRHGARASRAPPFGISTIKTEKHSRGAVDLSARDARAPREKGLAGMAEPVGVARPEAVGLEVLSRSLSGCNQSVVFLLLALDARDYAQCVAFLCIYESIFLKSDAKR